MADLQVPDIGNLTNYVPGSPNLYTGEVEWSAFDYKLSIAACAVFVAIFSISLVLHIGQAIISRFWFLLYTLGAAALGELIGWSFRLSAAVGLEWSPLFGGQWLYDDTAFMGQIASLIISPAFSTAANYVILGVLVSRLGPQYCRLAPKTYTWIFVTGDVLSLVIQAAGGGLAASSETAADADTGANIMVGGVIVQMVVMVAYTILFTDFCIHYLYDKPVTRWYPFGWAQSITRKLRRRRSVSPSSASTQVEPNEKPVLSPRAEKRARIMLAGLAGSTILIFIRSIFRTVELLDGWDGRLATDEVLFCVLDGAMIALSSLLLNVLHPMFLLREEPTGERIKDSNQSKEVSHVVSA